MRKLILFGIVLSIFTATSGCQLWGTRVNIKVPEKGIELAYNYSVFQEKYLVIEETEAGEFRIEFKSKSDPLMEALKTVGDMAKVAKTAAVLAADAEKRANTAETRLMEERMTKISADKPIFP